MELKPCAKSETVTYTVYPEHLKEFLAERHDARDLIVTNVFEMDGCCPIVILEELLCMMFDTVKNRMTIEPIVQGTIGSDGYDVVMGWKVGIITTTREDDE